MIPFFPGKNLSIALALASLFCLAAHGATMATAAATSKGDDERVARAYKYIVELRPDKGIAALVPPLTEALRSNDVASRKRAARYYCLIGWAFRLDENDNSALGCLRIAAKLDPENVFAKTFQAEELMRLYRLEEADKLLDELRPLARTNVMVARLLAFRAIADGEYDSAKTYLQAALQLDPKDSRSHSMYGRLLFDNAAAEQFKLAADTTVSPYMREIYLWETEMAANPKQATAQHLEAAGKILPDDPLWHNKMASHLVRRQQVDAAGKHMLAGTQCRRFSARSHTLYSAYAMFHNDAATSLRCLEHLTKVLPNNAEAHWTLANYHLVRQQDQKAEASFRKAIALNPRHSAAYSSLSEMSVVKNNRENQDKLSANWIASCPTQPQAWIYRGDLLRKDEKWADAEAAYEEARKNLPERLAKGDYTVKLSFCSIFSGIGTCRYKQNNVAGVEESAIKFNFFKPVQKEGVQVRPPRIHFDKLKPGSVAYIAAVHGCIADMLFETRELDAAVYEYKKAVELEPDNPIWHRGLLKVYLEKQDWVAAAKEDMLVSNDMVTRELPKAIDDWKKNVFPSK
jgi:tetratricopeptide (TPR) repeat protein